MVSVLPAPAEESNCPSDGTPNSERRRVLAIDYGRKRLGLALSDDLGMTAQPFATWTRINRRRDLARLHGLCRERAVGHIIVGWPIRLDGTQGEMAEEAARFADRVRQQTGLPVELVDERLSSWAAGQTLDEAPRKTRHSRGGRGRKTFDDIAAAVILRDYLSRTGEKSRAESENSSGPKRHRGQS